MVTLDNLWLILHAPLDGDNPFKRLPYQLLMIVAMPIMVTTGDRESGFDSREGA